MPSEFSALTSRPLAPDTRIRKAHAAAFGQFSVESPALGSMTDLTLVPAATIEPARRIDEANRAMIGRGVRLLFAVQSDGAIVGLITATDLLGEKPMRVVQSRGIHHDEILVEDVMTPAANLEVLAFDDVRRAKLGQIVATLRTSGRQHALVVEHDPAPFIRGIFSATQIARNLGVALQTPAIFKTFAEIEAALRRR